MGETYCMSNEAGAKTGLEWKELYERTEVLTRGDVLRSLLLRQLHHGAISSYRIDKDPVLKISLHDEPFGSLVISPLEWFLFGEEPNNARKKLSDVNSPPTLCGKVFKTSEPTYSCRDCALDATCVLCMECFRRSIHKDHNYRLSTSSGGGCCDCGDPEAWKQGPSCELHTAHPDSFVQEDPLKKLSQDFLDRVQFLCSVLLDYCVNLVCDSDDELFPELKSSIISSDCYATVLFNDESHTFDEVISALVRSLPHCNEKLGKDFATVVDREGRSTVFVGTFEVCNSVCSSVQDKTRTDRYGHSSGPLRCETVHIHLIANQQVALRLMKWLSELTAQSDCLRRLHCLLSTSSFNGELNHLARVLRADAKLWKAARVQTHQLFMNTLLTDPQGKVTFGIEFAKNYPILMSDFYADDQEHGISATSMSVQLFTVPSLVQMLVVEYDLLEVVTVVLSEKSKCYLGDGHVFNFQKDSTGKSTRLYYIIHDLRYILQNKHNEWNDLLREKFLRFLEVFLSFYRRFQGMNSTKRATGIHVEVEPDWQTGFEFEMHFREILPLITRWCKSDRDVFLKSVDLTLKCLKDVRKITGGTKLKKHHEGKKSLKTFDFDVSSERVSIHIPIVRFLAGLIEACEMYSINIPELLEIKKEDDILMFLEYPLKVLVMVAQVKAGMWKKNGYSVLNQVRWYQKDYVSVEMYEKDILFMQALASCMNKDHFFTVLLDMFKLSRWASPNYDVDELNETTLQRQLSLAEEFLHLLIVILGERYKCGVGQANADSQLRREVIHRLCLGTMPRSELMRGLPLPESEYEQKGGLDEVILSVATFKKPGLSSKGLYELKKEYLGEFNPYFYHYSKNEESKAEEYVRRRFKEERTSAIFAPPAPVEFSPTFSNVVDLLSCKKLVELLAIILWRIKQSNPKSWTDRIFHETLHLIGLALHEERRQREKQQSFGFLNAARKRLANVCKYSLFQSLEALLGNPTVEAHSGLLRWTITKFKDEVVARHNPDKSQALDTSAEVREVPSDQDKIERQRLAKEKRDRVMAQMSNMQRAFIRQNSDLYLSTDINIVDQELDYVDSGTTSSPDHISAPVIAIGCHRTPSVVLPGEQLTCILCQEKQSVKSGDRVLVFSAYIQRSTVLAQARGHIIEEGDEADPLVPHRDHRVGVHMGSCGHVMHADCWQGFYESLLTSERRFGRLRIHSTDISKREFLCPLCEGISNAVLPLLPSIAPSEEVRNQGDVSWIATLHKIQQSINKDLPEFVQTSSPSDNSYISFFKEKLLTFLRLPLSVDMNSMITLFSQAAFTVGLNVQPDEEDNRVPLMVWSTCAYTIHSLEHCSRGKTKPLVESLRKQEMDAVRSLVLVANSVSTISKPFDVLNHCFRLVSVLPGCERLVNKRRSLMDIDLFDWMVKMRFSLPSMDCLVNSPEHGVPEMKPHNSSLELDEFTFHLALVGSITQLLLTSPEDIPTDEMDDHDEDEEVIAEKLSSLWRKLKDLRSPHLPSTSHPCPQRLLCHIRYRLLPFLRCCAMFFHLLNSTRVPVALKENFTSLNQEYDALAEYLALPKDLTVILGWNDKLGILNDNSVTVMLRRWCLSCNANDSTESPVSFSLEPNTLIELPNDYSELIIQASNFNCPVYSGEENRVPTKCLVCGQMMCSEGYCCKEVVGGRSVGSCTAHALRCGAGIGIFLRVRDCIVLLISGIGKGCFYPPPYLDAYGETDRGLRRGNPLYLCHERYNQLQKLWKQHGIASEIARYLESNRPSMAIDWASY